MAFWFSSRGKISAPIRPSGRLGSSPFEKLKFVAEKPPPSPVFTEVALMAAEQRMEYSL
jgi:hypothetical protein